MEETYSLFTIPLRALTPEAYRAYLRTLLQGDAVSILHTVNPEMLVDARLHPEFAHLLASATACVPDGAGILYACLALFGEALSVHPGVDTIMDLMDIAHEHQLRIAVCGARAQEHEHFRVLLAKRAPAAELLCIDPGIIDERDPHIPLPSVERLSAFAPQIVLVALGQGRGVRQGKQERVMRILAEKVPSARIMIGVGGALDMLGGSVGRAPQWMRSRNLEWLYRFILQPWRWTRIVKAVCVFPLFVVWETLRTRVFFRATARVVTRVYKDLW